jgi:hypothetical protein
MEKYQMAIKKFKVGNVQLKKDRSGVTVALGNYSKDPKYATTVEMIVRDGSGNVLAKTTGGFLQVVDPRKQLNKDGTEKSEEQLAKIPEWIKNELFIIVEE